jgi:uncharacterized coiled-coil DUF342 family protein
MANKEVLINELKQLNSEIANMKKKVGEVDREKEDWFKKKEELKTQIKTMIRQIKDIKNKKDEFNKSFIIFKKERDKHNSKVQDIVKKLRQLNEQKKKTFEKYKIKVDPNLLKKKIENLEEKIEIEAFSFNKEKKIMEQIKKLRKDYDESKKVTGVTEEIDNLVKDLNDARKKSNEFHSKLIESKDGGDYSDFAEMSKKISSMRKIQQEAFNMFIKMKNEFSKVNVLLKAKLLRVNKIKGELGDDKKVKLRTREMEDRRKIEIKAKEVEEKLKTKKKLTTDDLLVYQSKDDQTTDNSDNS